MHTAVVSWVTVQVRGERARPQLPRADGPRRQRLRRAPGCPRDRLHTRELRGPL